MSAGRSPKPAARASREDWFRSADWDDQATTEFEARLARARPFSRPQYRRIKAFALLNTGDAAKEAAGRGLLEQVIDDPDVSQFQRVMALSILGAHEHDAGRLGDAERHLRAALSLIAANPNGSSGLENVRLAEILLARGDHLALEEARRTLDRAYSSPPLLLSSQFRMCLAGVRVDLALGHHAGAAGWASVALQLADATHSRLAKHPKLGLVETDSATRAWLTSVVHHNAGS
jgi:hypothetical protein